MPSATGTSMPMRRCERAPGGAEERPGGENSTTGSVSTQLPQFSSWRRSGASSPASAT
jgi:hypothetical protein